ncbi:hypothetical protein CRH09_18625 [Nocardia terpenica]|uniref:Uncharacterized protein n=1 Tax=Nocardia terpenica TaxID=455432 RepID=A0A291RKT0_9NOCA|nr:hypothetical protein CRH09_18625 [Nocardia terpenica]
MFPGLDPGQKRAGMACGACRDGVWGVPGWRVGRAGMAFEAGRDDVFPAIPTRTRMDHESAFEAGIVDGLGQRISDIDAGR